MPILNDLLDHEVIGPAIRQGLNQGLEQGLQEGLQQGLQRGRQEGLQRGRQEIVKALLEKRFGALPEWAESRIAGLSAAELDGVAVRLLDIQRLEDLLPEK